MKGRNAHTPSCSENKIHAINAIGGEKCTYTILQWTEDELIIQEDLTEHFRSLYPNAGVTDVKRKITWARYYKPMGNVR